MMISLLKKLFHGYFAAFDGLPRKVWEVCIIFFINRAGTMVMPFISVYLVSEMGISASQAGLLIGLFGLGSVIGSYFGGWWCTVSSPVWVQSILLFLLGIGFWLLRIVSDPFWIGAILFFCGFTGDGFRPANWVAMTQICPKKLHKRGFALNRVFVNLGWAIGPAFGGILAAQNYDILFYVNAFTAWIAAFYCLWIFRGQNLKPKKEKDSNDSMIKNIGQMLKNRSFVFSQVAMLLGTFVFFQFYSTFPVYAKSELGFDEKLIGYLFAINPILIVLTEVYLIQKIERFNPLRIIALGILLIGLGWSGMGSVESIWLITVFVIIQTLGEIYSFPVCSAYVSSVADEKTMGHYMGVHSSVFSIGIVLAPIVGLSVYETYPSAIWLGGLVVSVFAAALIYFRPDPTTESEA